ncbi:MAG: peptidylprolyl isomerase [Andreesenia angusta]|nr:peptidylprolyl isomerase [Andreesenia angusta]
MKNPIVKIELENGKTIEAELYPEIAPNTVKNFIYLINKGFYDGLIFHRVIPNFMIQGGCPDGNGTGGPGYSIRGEFTANGFKNDLLHERGVLSMARAMDPNSAGSQFFIMTETSPHLDNQYAAFGRVLNGMEAVDEIVSEPRDYMDRPMADQKIKKMTVDTFDTEYEEPEKV